MASVRCSFVTGMFTMNVMFTMYFTNSNALDEREPATGFAVIPYIQGVTEPIKRILNSHNVKVAQKPFQTLGHIFAKPKDPVTKEQRTDEGSRNFRKK